MTAGQHTYMEIMSQPDVWAEALAAFDPQDRRLQSWLEAGAFDHVIVTGCGSTFYLALTAARLLRQAGCHALACPASELLLHPQSIYIPGQRYLLLCLSRSGRTSETVRAQELFKSQVGGPVIAVTCEGGSPLAQDAGLAIAIDAAQERSVAQTRSFSSMLVVAQQLAALVAGHDLAASRPLPAICRRLLEQYGALAQSLGENSAVEKFFFLGSDGLYGVACEAMLKMKEMSLVLQRGLSHAGVSSRSDVDGRRRQPSHRLDFARRRSPGTPRSGRNGGDGRAQVLAIAPAPRSRITRSSLAADGFARPGVAPVLYLPALHLLAFYRAQSLTGCDPDRPQNLSAVVSLGGHLDLTT